MEEEGIDRERVGVRGKFLKGLGSFGDFWIREILNIS